MFPPREGCVDRSRVSIGFDESPKYGIYYSKRSTATDSLFAGYASKRHRYFPFVQAVNDDIARSHSWYGAFEDDIVFWWGMSAFFNKQIVRGTFTCIDRFGLDKSGVFKGFIPLLIGTLIPLVKRTQAKNLGLTAAGALAGDFGEAALEEDTADELSLLLEGSTRTRANLLTYRNGDVMMSTLQNFRPGQLNFQSSVNQATLNSTLTVFTTSGFAGFEISNLAVAEGGALLGGIVGGPIGAVAGGVGAVIVNESLIEGMNPIDQVDGPDWWTGYWSLPVIAQHRSAVIAAYDFHAIQKFLAEAGSHAWFPKAGFDRVEEARTSAYEDENFFLLDVDNIGPKGFWLFGKVVHRVEGVSAADWPEAYIGVFSNQRPQWLSLAEDADIYEERLGEKADEGVWKRPLPMDYFADRDWYVEGKNVWIVQVGNQDEFGGFDEFKRRVTGARIALDDSGGMECSYDIPLPGGSSERLSLTYEDGGRFSLDGRPFQTDYYPRFENRFLRSGRAEWGQRAYVIEYRGKTLLHDYSDYGNPIRREAFQPTEDEADLVRALVIFLKTEDEALEEFAVGTATVRIGGQTATEAQVIAAGPVSEETPHDAEWIFFDRAVRCAPDATLELGHGLIANRTSLLDAMTSPEEFALDLLEGSPEWTVSFSVKALMGDCTLRDCSLTAGRASFEDRSVAGPFPFSIALSKWRRWEPVATRTSRRRLIAGRPPWGTAYYDYCDLLAWDDDDRLWHRRIDACLRRMVPQTSRARSACTRGPAIRARCRSWLPQAAYCMPRGWRTGTAGRRGRSSSRTCIRRFSASPSRPRFRSRSPLVQTCLPARHGNRPTASSCTAAARMGTCTVISTGGRETPAPGASSRSTASC
jgi:hypothetical protein